MFPFFRNFIERSKKKFRSLLQQLHKMSDDSSDEGTSSAYMPPLDLPEGYDDMNFRGM